MPAPLITLITDFGTRDPYVGAMKGVIAGIAPKCRVIDITHQVPPFNIQHAAYVLRSIWPWYPPGTIHVAVVDPGVGSDRDIVLAGYAGRYVLAPDNGLITMVHRDYPIDELYVVENRSFFIPQPSATFHGRDIFSPVAAHLANGVKPSRFGRAADHVEVLSLELKGTVTNDGVTGRIIYQDRFGNLVTNIGRDDLGPICRRPENTEVFIDDASVGPLRCAYHEVAPGEPLALIGSLGFLEISVNQGNAAERFSVSESTQVQVRAMPNSGRAKFHFAQQS